MIEGNPPRIPSMWFPNSGEGGGVVLQNRSCLLGGNDDDDAIDLSPPVWK